jgi:hypothetical protein
MRMKSLRGKSFHAHPFAIGAPLRLSMAERQISLLRNVTFDSAFK